VADEYKQFDDNDAKAARIATAKVNLSEALGESAQKQKRNLLVWAGLAFLVDFYDVHIKHIPWIDTDIPPGSPSAAIAILTVPLLYSFFGFVLYAYADLKRWRISAEQNWLLPQANVLFRLQANTHAILSQLDDTQRPAHVTPEQSRDVIEKASQEALHATGTLESLRKDAVRLTWLNRFIAYGWEFVVPVVVGGFALSRGLPVFWRSIVSLVIGGKHQ
jgi:hypothetical protein